VAAAVALSTGALTARGVGEATLDVSGLNRLNPMIRLLENDQPVFGLYAPRASRGGRRGRGTGARTPADVRTAADLARETLAYDHSDYIFDGSMEGSVDRGLPAFVDLVAALAGAGARAGTHPLIVKTPKIADDPALAVENISRQLNAGVSGVMFVGVESAHEMRTGLAAMRFRSNGGTRPDDVGDAPAYWGLSEAEYRERADLWPLNPDGELISWTIVESHEGLANVREIAAVPGIGVLWPGAGTLRGLFTSTDASGERVFDAEGWEAAIQQVLAACEEFDVACGYPATASDIEMRIAQGFRVFVMNWGEGGFETITIGRRLSGR
jgi:2-keto-3-deoxy-L-rhamnonate aldolase RhmA